LVDYLFLGGYHVTFSRNSDLENSVIARLHFEGNVIKTDDGALLDAVSIDEAGTHLTNERATRIAKDRLLKLLESRKWPFLDK
jgi:hypothetical protein